MTDEPLGRRERKKLQTRRALAEAALSLFLEKGYDQVSVKEIADAVDISVPTVFSHVPDGKEALMFDDGVERLEGLLAAVHDRPAGQSVMGALRDFMGSRGPFMTNPSPGFRRRTELILATPALRDFTRILWVRCEAPLAEAIAAELGRAPRDPAIRALARFVLEIPEIVSDEDDPRAALDAIFDVLERGAHQIVDPSAAGAAAGS